MSGRDLLLEYAFPIEAIEPLPSPSAAYLKQVCIVAKPKSGQEGNVGTIYECLNMAAVAARTDNTNAQQSFNAGMTKVYILLADDLDLTTPLSTASTFFTLLISDDFDDEDISQEVTSSAVAASKIIGDLTFTAIHAGLTGNDITIELSGTTTEGNEIAHAVGNVITVEIEDGVSTAAEIAAAIEESTSCSALVTVAIASGEESTAQDITDGAINLEGGAAAIHDTGTGVQVGDWGGVIGVSSSDVEIIKDQAILTRRTGFFTNSTNKAKNMFYAFGKLLSGRDWKNQQYIEMPFNDEIDDLSEAENLFDGSVSFILSSAEYGNRLALFANNRKAIVAPYIFEYFQLSMQGWGVQYIALNQPAYTVREASLLQDYLQEKADERFVASEIVEVVTVKISLVEDNFVANGDLVISEPKALWRVRAKLQQGLI